MRILIAEDDMASRRFLTKLLAPYGEVDTVVDGLEALDAYLMAMKDEEPYSLICLDIMMPKVDGVKVLKAIREYETQKGIRQENRSRIMMTTALAEAEYVKESFRLGCEAYAAKPIHMEKFYEALHNMGFHPSASDHG